MVANMHDFWVRSRGKDNFLLKVIFNNSQQFQELFTLQQIAQTRSVSESSYSRQQRGDEEGAFI